MKHIKNNIKNIFKTYKENWIEWTLLIVVLFLSTSIFLYHDLLDTVGNSLIFIKAITTGNFTTFYDMTVLQSTTSYAANYNVMIYLIFSIWLLPFYGITKLLNKDFLSWPISLLYSKGLLVLATIFAAYLIYKIIIECTSEKNANAKLAPFIFLSSAGIFFAIFITAQLDIISLCFMLLGLLAYLKHKNVLFILSFMIAAPLKMFSILLALPLILLREKNLIKAGLLWISTTSLLIVEKLIFRGSTIYNSALSSQSQDAIKQVLNSNINLGKPIIIFVVLYICLLVYALICEKKDDKNLIVYMAFFVFGTFCAFVRLNAYWIILTIPFLIINIFVNKKLIGLNVLLETASFSGYLLYMATVGSSIFQDTGLTSRLLLTYFIKHPNTNILKYKTVYNFSVSTGIATLSPLCSTVFVACLVIILVISCPLIKIKIKSVYDQIPRWALFLRVGILAASTLLIVYICNTTTNAIFYSNLNAKNTYEEINLVDHDIDNVITQEIQFDDDINLQELTLKFYNSYYTRSNFSKVKISICEAEKTDCIFATEMGGSEIKSDELIHINLNNTEVKEKTRYEIRLSGSKGTEVKKDLEKIYPYFIDDVDTSLTTAKINNEDLNKTLYFEIR